MADTAVAITEGTGTNIDTRTEGTNGNHRQVIVIGDPATNAGVAPVDATAGLKVDLGADNDVTVTGTVDLGATDNAVLDAIAASVAAIDADATTIIGHVDGLETLITSTNTKLDTVITAVQIIDNIVSGNEAQVDVLTMPTTTVTNTPLTNIGAGEYETVAASQTAQVLGATGGAGDYLAGVLIVPATTSPGNVLILDNATSITIFAGGASSVSTLHPFYVPLGMISVSGAWKITTGANVSAIGIGNFT